MSKKWLLSLCLVLFLFGAAACGGSDDKGSGEASSGEKKNSQKQEQKQKQGNGDAPKPDLKGIPEVVAEVNGEKIAKAEFVEAYKGQFQQLAMQSQTSGQELDQDQLKKQTVDSMIGTELLVQEADKRDLTASEKDVNNTLNELAQQNGLKSADEFMAAMQKQGMNEKEVRSELETQVKVDQLVAAEAGDTRPTEKEIKQLYAQLTAQQEQSGGQGSEVPPLKKVRPQLEEQVKSQKESEAAQALVRDFRKDADVTVNL